MYRSMGNVTLKTGEVVEMGVVRGPEPPWADRIEDLLAHKGDPWTWQNASVLREEVGIEAYFYILHRGGRPLANIMTAELEGVGIFGHVWTQPPDRQKGAASGLMARQMEDFRARGGRALFLGTGWESHAYRMYRRFGFRGVEDRSGCMEYYTASREGFEADYFATSATEIQEIDWRHWPAAPALFMGDFPGVVRWAAQKLFGRHSTEGPLLGLIRRERTRRDRGEGRPPAALALVNTATTAVVGLAARTADPVWPRADLVDVYCHPDHWTAAGELLAGVLGDARRCVAYADYDCPQRQQVLTAAGFQPAAVLERWVAADAAGHRPVNIGIYERRP